MLQQEQIGGAEPEHDDGIAVEAVTETAPPRQCEILLHRQRADVADASLLEIAGAGVVDRMALTPDVVRRQSQRANQAPDPIVYGPPTKKGAVSAIMLNHEEPDE